MATSKITMQVDAKGAITNLGKMQKQLDSTNKSIKGIMKSLQESNTNEAKGIANIDFKNYITQLERQADAYKLVDDSGNSYRRTVKLYENALLSASKQNQFTIEQIGVLKEKLDDARKSQELFNKENGISVSKMDAFKNKMMEVGKNILVFQTAIALFRKTMTAIKNTIKSSIESASSAEQVFSKLSTVYDGFSDSALIASKKLADSLGVSQTTASSALSTIGDLLQAQGMSVSESLETASTWAKQLQDIIAFKDLNMTLEEFAQNFMSGAAGNLRNFRTFGSIVKESAVEAELARKNLDNLTGSELELAKMTIRANMALEQQANAMGATEREWDTALSINRRLTEATKEWKENLGDSLNKFVKPLKEFWVEILETINESVKKQKELKEAKELGAEYFNTSDKNPTNDTKTAAELAGKVEVALSKIQIDTSESATWIRDFKAVSKEVEQFDEVVSVLKDAMALTNASVDDINKKWALSADILRELTKYEEKRTKELKRQKELEAQLASLKTSIEVFDSLTESLLAIKGVSFDVSAIQFGAKDYNTAINDQFIVDSTKAVESIMSASARSMGKAFEETLGEFVTTDLLEMQKESMRSVAEIQWNQFNKDGNLTEEENKVLKDTIEKYKELNEQLDIQTTGLSAKASINSTYKTLLSEKQDKEAVKTAQRSYGYNEAQAKLYVEQQNKLKELNKTYQEVAKAGLATADTYKEYQENIKLINEYYKEQIENAKEQEPPKSDNDWEAVLTSFAGAFSGIVENIMNLNNLDDPTSKSDWVMAIISIAQQMETFAPAFEIADEVLARIDEFLSPFGKAIGVISSTTLSIISDLMPAFFPLIKDLAMQTTIINGIVDSVRIIIKNIFTAVHNVLQYLIHPLNANKRDMWAYESLSDSWEKTYETLLDIKNLTYDIKENTDDVDTSAYDEMYRQGFLTLSEYNALLSDAYGKKWDSVNTFTGGSYQNGSGGTTIVYSGDMHITIDGTNLSAKEIADELERRSIAGNKTYA